MTQEGLCMAFGFRSSGVRHVACAGTPEGENGARGGSADGHGQISSPVARIEIDDEDAPIIVMRREFGGNAEWCAASCRP